jgi:beta-lactamase class A
MNTFRTTIAWGIFFITIFYTILLVIRTSFQEPKQIISPVSKLTTNSPKPTPSNTPKEAKTAILQIDDIIKETLNEIDGSYGIYIHNIKTRKQLLNNEHQLYPAASLYKLWIMACVYDQIKKGTIHESDIIKEDIAVLNEKFNISSESAERSEGTVQFTVYNALYAMITISDNYAALLLTEKIGLSTVAKFLADHGLYESKVGIDGTFPETTASDIGLFFQKIYNGSLIDSMYDQKMIQLLKAQTINHKIPKLLPHTVEIAHKTGELGSYTHDGGIIYTSQGDYIFVVLTESRLPTLTEEYISNFSQKIYTYFTNYP